MLDGWSIDAAKRMVSVKFSGHLAFADLQAYIAGLLASPDFDPTFSELVDLAAVNSTELNYGKSAVLSEWADPYALSSRRAFVVVSEAVHHVVRMYQTLRGDSGGIRVFSRPEDAREWLQGP